MSMLCRSLGTFVQVGTSPRNAPFERMLSWNSTFETVPLTCTVPVLAAKEVEVIVFDVTSRLPLTALRLTPEVFSVYFAEDCTTPPMEYTSPPRLARVIFGFVTCWPKSTTTFPRTHSMPFLQG